jgi:hypothetical protein
VAEKFEAIGLTGNLTTPYFCGLKKLTQLPETQK